VAPSTSMRVREDHIEFEVSTSDSVYQEELRGFGFQRVSDDSFVRYVALTPDIEQIYQNFTQHLEEMLLQHAGKRPVPWEQALTEFLWRVEASDVSCCRPTPLGLPGRARHAHGALGR
jgi:hypothetical protein